MIQAFTNPPKCENTKNSTKFGFIIFQIEIRNTRCSIYRMYYFMYLYLGYNTCCYSLHAHEFTNQVTVVVNKLRCWDNALSYSIDMVCECIIGYTCSIASFGSWMHQSIFNVHYRSLPKYALHILLYLAKDANFHCYTYTQFCKAIMWHAFLMLVSCYQMAKHIWCFLSINFFQKSENSFCVCPRTHPPPNQLQKTEKKNSEQIVLGEFN